MRKRTMLTAQHVGIYEQLQELETDLLSIPEIVDVDFDIDSFLEDWGLKQVIIIPKYNISVRNPEKRNNLIVDIVKLCFEKYDLHPSGDVIEDMGEHLYIVRNTKTW